MPEKAPEPQINVPSAGTPAATPESAQDKEEQPKDSAKEDKPSDTSKDEKESTDSTNENNEESDEELLFPNVDFGKRHEIKGDLSQTKLWQALHNLDGAYAQFDDAQNQIENISRIIVLACPVVRVVYAATRLVGADLILIDEPA